MNNEILVKNTTTSDPWVESGAMVYVALTVATISAVIMCCTWFITHNSEVLRWWKGDNYGIVSDGENVELRTVEEESDEETIFDVNEGKFKDTPVDPKAFTLDGSSEDEEEIISSKSSAVDDVAAV